MRHKLHIENWQFNKALSVENKVFRLGTCHGMFDEPKGAVRLIAIVNDSPGNGDFARAMNKLEKRASGMDRAMQAVEIWNPKLKAHLIAKRGYIDKGNYVERVIDWEPPE